MLLHAYSIVYDTVASCKIITNTAIRIKTALTWWIVTTGCRIPVGILEPVGIIGDNFDCHQSDIRSRADSENTVVVW
jgi:hypothetical protein